MAGVLEKQKNGTCEPLPVTFSVREEIGISTASHYFGNQSLLSGAMCTVAELLSKSFHKYLLFSVPQMFVNSRIGFPKNFFETLLRESIVCSYFSVTIPRRPAVINRRNYSDMHLSRKVEKLYALRRPTMKSRIILRWLAMQVDSQSARECFDCFQMLF